MAVQRLSIWGAQGQICSTKRRHLGTIRKSSSSGPIMAAQPSYWTHRRASEDSMVESHTRHNYERKWIKPSRRQLQLLVTNIKSQERGTSLSELIGYKACHLRPAPNALITATSKVRDRRSFASRLDTGRKKGKRASAWSLGTKCLTILYRPGRRQFFFSVSEATSKQSCRCS